MEKILLDEHLDPSGKTKESETLELEERGTGEKLQKDKKLIEDDDIDFILTLKKPGGKGDARCCRLKDCNCCSPENNVCATCFEKTCLKRSPNSGLGACWWCACTPCLRDKHTTAADCNETDSPRRPSVISVEDWQSDELKTWLESMENDLDFEMSEKPMEDGMSVVKVRGKPDSLLRTADRLALQMPIACDRIPRQKIIMKEKNNQASHGIITRITQKVLKLLQFDKPPLHLEIDHYFCIPFKYHSKEAFLMQDSKTEWSSKDAGRKFFTSAQRSAIVHYILVQNGLNDKLAKGYFTAGFSLHEGPHKLENGGEDNERMTDRSFLYKTWAHPKNFYKIQPLDYVRRYFGEAIGVYFAWLGFYTMWLVPAAIVGFVVFLYGLSRIYNPIGDDICNEDFRYDFYMCPPCDGRCDFWYLESSCRYSRLALVFDNGGTVFFAIFMSFWTILFLEFWKRQQYLIQFRWNLLGYKQIVEKSRPQFKYRIKLFMNKRKEYEKHFFIRKNRHVDTDEDKNIDEDEGIDGDENRNTIQPAFWYYSKIVAGLTILATMVAVLVAIVIAVVIYRLAIAGAIYILVNNLPLGPSVGRISVTISGAIIQLVAIVMMNKFYTFLARWLTDWELHRTQTDFNNSFVTKMYIFQFVNFYASLFYIAFFKGNLSGSPGNYNRFSGLRVEECAHYGCLLSVTIQLLIIMVGKQIFNNIREFISPELPGLCGILTCKWNLNLYKWRKSSEGTTRYDQNKDLHPLGEHGLFFEYLELVIQYGFITIFVVALPLAPLFALINNIAEIRIDTFKFIVSRKRPVANRTGDIGSWLSVLYVVSKIAVVSNAFLIAFTSQFIPQAVFTWTQSASMSSNPGVNSLSGYVNWSLSPFTIDKLLDGRSFPAFTAHALPLYDVEGSLLSNLSDNALYLPYVDTNCMISRFPEIRDHLVQFNDTRLTGNSTEPYLAFLSSTYKSLFVRGDRVNETWRDLILHVKDTSRSPEGLDSIGECFLPNTQCRFRGFVEDNDDSTFFGGTKYLQVHLARLAFVVVFEHIIFVTTFLIDWMIPDIPKKVKLQIQREKNHALALNQQQHKREAN